MKLSNMMRKQIRKHISIGFAEALVMAFADKFEGIQIETQFNLFAMALVSSRVDGQDFTKEQAAFVAGFEEGYLAAAGRLNELAAGGTAR